MPVSDLPLRDIHIPEAIGWWPPAIGWWFLAAIIPVFIGVLYWFYKILTRKTAIKTAKKALVQIKQDRSQDNLRKLGELSILIRRVAISLAPRNEVASLSGDAWLIYLDSSLKDKPFSNGIGRYLGDGPYRKKAPAGLELDQLIGLCEEWLKAQAKNDSF